MHAHMKQLPKTKVPLEGFRFDTGFENRSKRQPLHMQASQIPQCRAWLWRPDRADGWDVNDGSRFNAMGLEVCIKMPLVEHREMATKPVTTEQRSVGNSVQTRRKIILLARSIESPHQHDRYPQSIAVNPEQPSATPMQRVHRFLRLWTCEEEQPLLCQVLGRIF